MTTQSTATLSSSPPAFSPVYFSPENSEDCDMNSRDSCASSSIVDVTSAPNAETSNDSTPHSAISPVARRMILGNDCDGDFDSDNPTRQDVLGSPLPLGNGDDDETIDQHENGHSLPDPEDLKLSVSAAASRDSQPFLSLPKIQKIIYPILITLLAIAIIVPFTLGAFGSNGQNNSITTQTSAQNANHVGDVDRMIHLQNYMVKYGVTSLEYFRDPGSSTMNTPQFQAILWLVNEDNEFSVLPALDQNLSTTQGYSLVTRYAMAVLYFATGGKNWDKNLNFLDPDKATCDWFEVFAPPKGQLGVLCNQNTQRIIGLSLISNNVMGTIPSELSHLTSLEYFESIENPLAGTIPSEWQRLTGLKTLVMSFNQLTGTLPSWMPQVWSNLEFLYLSNNAISGTIPDEFFQFQKLSVLALDDNILTGNTDVLWNSMQSLEYLYLEDNDFTGTLPKLLTKFNSALVNLDISSNRLSGTLPSDLFQLNHLEVLDLHDNRFGSNIPSFIPENNDRLGFIALHKNILGGTIPSTISNLRRLSHLDIADNRISGTIPNELERLSDTMTYLFLGANDYQEGPIPSLFYALTNLRELSMKSSKRTGTISRVIGALDKLLVLDLDNNQLTGSIPNEIGTLTNLQFLLLNRNQLSSSVPGDSLAKLEKLRFLLLDNNHLFGDLNGICGLEFVDIVYVDCGEISCLKSCCSCCIDGQACHENDLISSNDPVWEAKYTRQFFQFSEGNGERFYSNQDDNYW